MKRRWIVGAAILIGLAIFIRIADEDAASDSAAEKQYYLDHPKTAVQQAADDHFLNCVNYRNTSHSVWSDKQRALMLAIEGCFSDDHDDPRYSDATYPWNAYAPHPWHPG